MKPDDLKGQSVRFNHDGKTLVGVVVDALDNGVTPRGSIPDLLVTVRGGSGRTLTVSLVESHLQLIAPET